jgi:hypothetical protein
MRGTGSTKINEDYDKHELLLKCDCGDNSHIISIEIEYDEDGFRKKYPNTPDSDWLAANIEINLNRQNNFLKRLWIAFLYVFGKESRYYSFENIILNGYQLKKLNEFINKYIK